MSIAREVRFSMKLLIKKVWRSILVAMLAIYSILRGKTKEISGAKEVRFSLKLMINKEKTKVLFSHVDSAFADVLLGFLTLPLGRILRLLNDRYGEHAPHIGCLNYLQNGLRNLDSEYFWSEARKEMLLDPRSSCPNEYIHLIPNVFDTRPTKFYTCERKHKVSLGGYGDSVLCDVCWTLMNKEINLGGVRKTQGEIFTKQGVSFLIGDDLRMLPDVTGLIGTLNNLSVTDIDGAEFITVSVGMNEIMDLLKESLFSDTPLTSIFLQRRSPTKKFQPISLLPHMRKEKKMKIKATVQMTKNKFLFAEAEEDFVDFLFSLLTFPLGQVESLLGMNSSLGCIDNLYRSVAIFDGNKCLKRRGMKDVLLKPKLPPHYLTKHQIFSVEEQALPKVFRHEDFETNEQYFCIFGDSFQQTSFLNPHCFATYVKENTRFILTDDLTVKPLSMLSGLSFIRGLNIPLSDMIK